MFGTILKDLRKEKNILQVSLAQDLHVTQATISSWEIGRTSPTFSQLNSIANYFKVSVDYLIGRVDEQNCYIYDLQNEEKEFLKLLSQLGSLEKKQLRLMIETFLSSKA